MALEYGKQVICSLWVHVLICQVTFMRQQFSEISSKPIAPVLDVVMPVSLFHCAFFHTPNAMALHGWPQIMAVSPGVPLTLPPAEPSLGAGGC